MFRLCILCIVCKCVLFRCHRVSTQLQLSISYHIISYHIIYLSPPFVPLWRVQEQFYPLFLLCRTPHLYFVPFFKQFICPRMFIFLSASIWRLKTCALYSECCVSTCLCSFIRCHRADGQYFCTHHALCIRCGFVSKARKSERHY
jgi:hypothetical protein